MSTIEHQRYIGDGVYARLHPARMIILNTQRNSWDQAHPTTGITDRNNHWIALEPEVLAELIVYACEIGWRKVIDRALEIATRRGGGDDDHE